MEPDEPELREELLAELRRLVADYGRDRFVVAPLTEPNASFFPDPWSPDEPGVATLARRVFSLAGLADVRIDLEDNPAARSKNRAAASGIRDTSEPYGPAQLLASDPSTCTLGVDFRSLSDPAARIDAPMLVASLCRAAALAYRGHGVGGYRDDARRPAAISEAQLRAVDVTTVYLGFGILTTNDAYRFLPPERSRGYTRDGWHRSAGSLSVDAMSFLLAVQVLSRDAARNEKALVSSLLAANQREAFARELSVVATGTYALP